MWLCHNHAIGKTNSQPSHRTKKTSWALCSVFWCKLPISKASLSVLYRRCLYWPCNRWLLVSLDLCTLVNRSCSLNCRLMHVRISCLARLISLTQCRRSVAPWMPDEICFRNSQTSASCTSIFPAGPWEIYETLFKTRVLRQIDCFEYLSSIKNLSWGGSRPWQHDESYSRQNYYKRMMNICSEFFVGGS